MQSENCYEENEKKEFFTPFFVFKKEKNKISKVRKVLLNKKLLEKTKYFDAGRNN